jgi:hypothetical protein
MTDQSIPDLLPPSEDLGPPPMNHTPVAILRAQAGHLKQKTQGDVLADVVQSDAPADRVGYWFQLVVPALQNYRYHLFYVEHGLKLYPLQIRRSRGGELFAEASTEPEFLQALRGMFGDSKTRDVIQQLRVLAAEQSDLTKAPADEMPEAIARENAEAFERRAQNRVRLEVTAEETQDGGRNLRMLLSAPGVHDEPFELVTIAAPVRGYPCRLRNEDVGWVADSEKSLRHYLQTFLYSVATKKRVNELLVKLDSAA